MDKQALSLRNRQLAAALHNRTVKENVRSLLLRTIAALPIPQQKSVHNRILVMRPDHLGDVLLTIPSFRALRRMHPNAEVHALIGTWSADILAPIPEIDLVLTMAFPGFSRIDNSDIISPYVEAWETARRLRGIGYDRVYILRRDHWWGALVAHLAGIPRRIGYEYDDSNGFLTDRIPRQPDHSVIENLRLINPLRPQTSWSDAPISYPVAEEMRLDVHDLLRQKGIDPLEPYFVIHVGSGALVKNWEAEKWAKVADALADGIGGAAILTGSTAERTAAERIATHMAHTPVIVSGETDLPHLAALLSEARLTLGADSGPLHLSAAVGSPTVTLFGPADPQEFRPWGNPELHRVVTMDIGCRPCRILDWIGDDLAFHPCVRDITVTQVIDAAWRALNSVPNRE